MVDEGEVEAAVAWEAEWEAGREGPWEEARQRDLLRAQAPLILAEVVHRPARISVHRM